MDEKPVRRGGGAVWGWAAEDISAAALGDLDLAPAKYPLADHADPFVIERIPASLVIRGAQGSEPIFEREMLYHASNMTKFGGVRQLGGGQLTPYVKILASSSVYLQSPPQLPARRASLPPRTSAFDQQEEKRTSFSFPDRCPLLRADGLFSPLFLGEDGNSSIGQLGFNVGMKATFTAPANEEKTWLKRQVKDIVRVP